MRDNLINMKYIDILGLGNYITIFMKSKLLIVFSKILCQFFSLKVNQNKTKSIAYELQALAVREKVYALIV